MSIETDFRAAVLAHSPLAVLVGEGVALSAVGEGQSLPYIIYTVEHDPEHALDGAVVADTATITAQCWAATALDAVALADALAGAIDAHDSASGGNPACWVTGSGISYDAELGLDAKTLTITWLAQ